MSTKYYNVHICAIVYKRFFRLYTMFVRARVYAVVDVSNIRIGRVALGAKN